jgi:hypothetical protein
MAEWAKQSGHWYARNGDPAYEVENKSKGGMRPTTIRDAKKLDLVPSVTGIIDLLDKPGLNNWKVDQGILAALTLPRNDGESEYDWLVRVKQDAKEHAIEAARVGTETHAAIERFFIDGKLVPEYKETVLAVEALLYELCPDAKWSAEKSFASPEGYGGKIDLHSVDPSIVIDFKGKEYKEGTKKWHWPEQAMQLGAYGHGLGLDDYRGISIFFMRNRPGHVVHYEWKWDDLVTGYQKFILLLNYWQLEKGYDSSFTKRSDQEAP